MQNMIVMAYFIQFNDPMVFVSGYLPDTYITKLIKYGVGHRIKLIHFNGSRKPFGCHADGHSHVTNIQFIPDESLIEVLKYAKTKGIPCVTE